MRRFLPQIFFNTGGGGTGSIMPDPNAPPAQVETPPAVVPAARRGGIECAFCECQIAPDGGVIKTSERARALAKAEDTIAALKSQLDAANAKIRELTPAPPAGGDTKQGRGFSLFKKK